MIPLPAPSRRTSLSIGLILLLAVAALTVHAGDFDGRPSESPQTTDSFDPLAKELSAQGGHEEVLKRWRLDDGQTVSVLWTFTTPQKENLQPVIEVPRAGAYPWYTGSSLTILDPKAYWTGAEWGFAGNSDVPFLRASDTNPPEEDKKKTVEIWYWWRGTFGPDLGIDTPGATFVDREEWPSHLYPGATFVIVTVSFGPPCPASVSATLTSRAAPSVQVRGFGMEGSCVDG
ncbi:MAG: hypothetical protein AAF481_14795 [Acidobacteriota bacterium]